MRCIYSSNDRYVQIEGVVQSPSSDGGVLYSPAAGTYYAVNEVGMKIWDCLASAATAAQVTAALAVEYDAPPDVLERDVDAALQHLESARLVGRLSVDSSHEQS